MRGIEYAADPHAPHRFVNDTWVLVTAVGLQPLLFAIGWWRVADRRQQERVAFLAATPSSAAPLVSS